MTACKNALIGSGTATATANGAFQINGCVLLFNGKLATSGPDAGLPTLKVFTRVQASNPSTISCANPTTNAQGNATILLNGVLRNATGLYGKVLDVNNITQSAAFPLDGVQDHDREVDLDLYAGQVPDDPLAHAGHLDLQRQHQEDGQQDTAVHLIAS